MARFRHAFTASIDLNAARAFAAASFTGAGIGLLAFVGTAIFMAPRFVESHPPD